MTDRWAVAVAVAAVVGAWRGAGVPLLVAALVLLGAVVARQPVVVCLGVAVLAGALADRSLAGLDGLQPGIVVGEVTLLTDPEPGAGGLQAEVRWGGRHLQLRASDGVAG